MKIREGMEMLELSANLMGKVNLIHPTLLWEEGFAALVDTGFPGQLAAIQAGMLQAGVPFEGLTHVILTHHDIDHIGSLASIRERRPEVRVLSAAVEKAYIQGDKPPLKLAQMGANLEGLSEDQKGFYQMMQAAFEKSYAGVDETLTDGQVLPYLGSIRVIDTPGHTLGHICLYLAQSKILIAGDALRVENGELGRPAPSLNADQSLSVASLKKLTNFDIAAVICYHGGVFQANPNRRIAELAKS